MPNFKVARKIAQCSFTLNSAELRSLILAADQDSEPSGNDFAPSATNQQFNSGMSILQPVQRNKHARPAPAGPTYTFK